MYYKIENKECEVYKKLHEMRTFELQLDKENLSKIREKIGLSFKDAFGRFRQQSFSRVPEYAGFEFTEPEKVDFKIWKRHKEYPEIFVPNTRTEAGREMKKFLYELKGSNYLKPINILGLPYLGKFTFPYVEISGELILIYLGDNHEPQDPNVIEITKREFEELLKVKNNE